MSNASPIGVAGARERARDLSRVGVETHPMSLIASSAPIPNDSATFPAMKSWRGSAIAVVDPYVGDRENLRQWMPSSVSAQICRERPANAPAATRRPTSATEPFRAEVLPERALSADPSVTHLTGRSRVSNTLVNGLSTATLRRVSSKRVPSHLALPRSGRGSCVRPTDYFTDQPELDVQDRTSAILTGTIDDC